MANALIIDDEKDIRELIEMAFISIGIDCVLAANIKEGISRLKKGGLDFCITDMRLPDGDGLDLVAYIQKNYPNLPVCVITAHGNMELAVKALKLGAFDFVNKPFDLKQLREMASSAIKLIENTNTTINTNKSHTDPIKKTTNNKNNNKNDDSANLDKYRIIGESSEINKLIELIKKLARSQAPVLIHGESGTGKELVARNIHHLSARHDQPFIAVNCGAIPENLVESEFFGYKKGAFTGANQDYPGLFVSANNGTLFLDEIADLPLNMQVKLLRAIQERAVRPVGGSHEINVNVRILSATHKDLQELVKNKTFREDLYYRLNVISLEIPPLRNRDNDIVIIANSILVKLSELHNRKTVTLADNAIKRLKKYDFPGNVRELENILERAITFCESDILYEKDFSFSSQLADEDLDINTWTKIPVSKPMEKEKELKLSDLDSFAPSLASNNNSKIKSDKDNSKYIDDDNSISFDILDNLSTSNNISENSSFSSKNNVSENIDNINDLEQHMANIEKNLILQALEFTNNNKTKAAEKLGISFRAFRYKLQKYQIK